MSSTDDRVVNMQFNNATFKKNALDSQKALADVDKAVSSAGKNKGMLDLNSNMQTVQVTASKMTTVVTAGLATITAKTVDSGLQMIKSMTFDPISQGFAEYESLLTKQNVIMNATGKSAKYVKGVLSELNEYSDQTIYSFGNMTDAVQKFVNAGVPLDQATVSIKGIANAAAFAGASSEEANRAMYAFSQSMSLGFIGLQDWNQIENANMGTIKFKEQLLLAGVAAGTLTKKGKGFITESGKFVSATEGWRDGLQEQWATTEVLNTALGKYADTNTKLGKAAFESATEVRTFSAFMDTLKEGLGSGWSQIFTALIGGLGASTKMWTGLSNAVGGVANSMFEWAVTTLKTWRQMGGFEKLMGGFKNLLSPIAALFGAIGTAFRAAFPDSGKGSGKTLYALSAAFEFLTRPLTWLADGITSVTPLLTFLFQVIKIGAKAIGTGGALVADFVDKVIGLVDLDIPSGGGLVGFVKDLAKEIGNAVGKISDLLGKGQSLTQAFGSVSFDMPSMPSMPDMPSMPSLPSMSGIFDDGGATSKIAALTGGVSGLAGSVDDLKEKSEEASTSGMFNPNAKLDTSRMADAGDQIESVGSQMDDVTTQAKSWGGALMDLLGNLKDDFLTFISGFSGEDLVSSFNMAVLATFAFTFIKVMRSISNVLDGWSNIGQGAADALTGLGDALGSLQTTAQAKLIWAIAFAMLALVASIFLLSLLPADQVAKGLITIGILMKGMSILMGDLTSALDDMKKDKVSAQLIALAVVLVAFALAMIILVGALVLFQFVDWESIAKGVIMMEIMLWSIERLAEVGDGDSAKKMLAASVALIAMAYALGLMALSLLIYKLVDWESIGKGGVVLAVMAGTLALLALLPAPSLIAVGKAMLATSAGMVLMATALLLFKFVDWESIGKLAVVLAALAVSLGIMMAIGGPVAISGMIGLGIGMMAIATAGLILNSVDWDSIKKIAAILGILVVAVALLGVVAYFAAAPLVALGQAFLMMGAGVALFGLGIALFVTAMTAAIALGAAGAAAFAALATAAAVAIAVFLQTLAAEAPIIKQALLDILQEFINGIVEAVPMVIRGFKDLWNAVVKELGGGGQKQAHMGDTGESWISKLAAGVKKKLPIVVKYAADLIISFLRALGSRATDLAAAGVNLVVKLLKGVGDKASQLVAAGVDLVVKLIEGIGKNAVKLARAAAEAIIDFVEGIEKVVREDRVIQRLVDAGVSLGEAIIEGVLEALGGLVGSIGSKVAGMAGDIRDAITSNLPDIDIPGLKTVAGTKVGAERKRDPIKAMGNAIVKIVKRFSLQLGIVNELFNSFIQQLDIKAKIARGQAEGLAAAADRASKAADKTKRQDDDRAANRAQRAANRADAKADKREAKAAAEKAAQDRKKAFKDADLLGKAQIRASEAANSIEAAKNSERKAAAARAEADALDKMANSGKFSAKEAKKMRADADKLRKDAKGYDQDQKNQLKNSRELARQAMNYQKLAGEEAQEAFDKIYKDEADAVKKAAEFAAMTNAQKAESKRKEAKDLQALADKNIEQAKELAMTDLQAANDLARLALDQADAARDALKEAEDYANNGGSAESGSVVDLAMTEAASIAANQYAEGYSAAAAAAAGRGPSVTINQTNNSPEALSDVEIYRQTRNASSLAVAQLETAGASA